MLPGHWGTREWAPPRLLLEALEQVRVLQDPQVLRDCIHWVESSLGVSLEVHEGPHRRVWLVNLLLALREHPRGLRALEGWIALLAPKTHDVSRLRVAIAVTEVPLLPAKDWERLLDLLRDVPSCDLGDAYEELFYGRGEPLSPDDADDPLFVVLHAATLNRVPGRPHPCVEMVARVAELAGGACAEGLRSWVEDHGGTGFNLEARHRTPWPPTHEQRGTGTGGTPLAAVPPFDELPVPPKKTESASGDLGQDVWSPGACLSIRIRHLADDAPESSRVLVSSWWQITHRGGLAFKGEDVLITEREAPGVVQALVEEAESGWAHRYQEDLALEFFLPEDLIHLPVERWPKLPFNGAEAALGEDHPVVVRSLDRLERPAIHGRWQQQWAIGLSTETGGRIHWFPGDGRGVIRTDPPTVVVLSSPPGPAAAPLGSHELAQALRAGAGVIIWDRREDPDPSFRDELTQILGRSDLRRLPAVVQTLRIRAWNGDAGEGSAVGCHLALLWDDPYRLPVAPGSGTAGTSPRRGSGHHAF